MINYMSNGKVIIIHLIVGLKKKIQCDSIRCNCLKISQYFPKPSEAFGGDVNVKVDLSNYATKSNKLVAKVNSTDTTGFVLKTKYDTDKS